MTQPRAGATFHLLSLGRLHLLPGETVPLLQHRHMLSIYLLVLFLLIGLDTNDTAGRVTIEMRGTLYIVAMASFLLVLAAGFQAAFAIAARRGQSVAVHMSPILFAATVCAVVSGESLLNLLAPPPDRALTRLLLLVAFHYMLAELALAIVAHNVLPVVLAQVRGLPIRKLAETDPALWADSHPPATPPSAARHHQGFLLSAGRNFPLQGLVHLQADGNYVHLWSLNGHHLLPGPLSDLVLQLPQDMGRQVHRSHWVAASALRDWRAEGREITLRLTNGQTVPVAVTRRREIRDWLVAFGLPQDTSA